MIKGLALIAGIAGVVAISGCSSNPRLIRSSPNSLDTHTKVYYSDGRTIVQVHSICDGKIMPLPFMIRDGRNFYVDASLAHKYVGEKRFNVEILDGDRMCGNYISRN